MSWTTEWGKIKREFPPTRDELLEFLLAAVVIGFIISFRDWGITEFSVKEGLVNWLIGALIAAIALAIHHGAQRLVALRIDTKVENRLWWNGSVVAILLAFVSAGALPFVALTRTTVTDLKLHRLGHYRYRIGTVGKMWTVLAGPLANGIVALLAWSFLTPSPNVSSFIMLNLMMAFFNILPIPPLDGIYVFYVSRTFYATIFGGIFAAGIGYLIGLTGILLILIILIGVLVAGLAWHYWFERD